MTIVMGKLLLLAGCSVLGLLRGLELKNRTACLADFRRALGALSRELTFSLRPLPDLVAGVQGEGPAGVFFALCRTHFQASGGESWTESWQRALEDSPLPLKEEDIQILWETGEVLGRYDGDCQRQAMEGLLVRLEESLTEARAEEQRLFRVYTALGITAGLFLCILL